MEKILITASRGCTAFETSSETLAKTSIPCERHKDKPRHDSSTSYHLRQPSQQYLQHHHQQSWQEQIKERWISQVMPLTFQLTRPC